MSEFDDLDEAIKRFEALHLRRTVNNPPVSTEVISTNSLSSSEIGNDEELSRIRNENYHLKLALNEKEDELNQFKRTVQRTTILENMHNYVPYNEEPPFFLTNSPPRSKSIYTDFEIVTHISGSPYKGKRSNSKATESSLATTAHSKVKMDYQFFKSHILPFVEKMISILRLNGMFKEEGQELSFKYADFEDKDVDYNFKIRILATILDDILYYNRQTTSILNRELKFKELSQRLEYLFSIFLDPREYDLDPQDHIEYLREEIMDTLLKIFNYHDMPNNKDEINYERKTLKTCQDAIRNYIDNDERTKMRQESALRLKNIEQGFEICAHAMNQAFGDKKELRPQESSTPSTMSSIGMSTDASKPGNNNEKHRLKESKESLEFIPIGYDENMLNSKTPQRLNPKGIHDCEITPKAADENDPLQMFFQEQASYYDMSVERRRK